MISVNISAQLRSLNMASCLGLQYWPLPPHPACLPALKELVLQRCTGIREIPYRGFLSVSLSTSEKILICNCMAV